MSSISLIPKLPNIITSSRIYAYPILYRKSTSISTYHQLPLNPHPTILLIMIISRQPRVSQLHDLSLTYIIIISNLNTTALNNGCIATLIKYLN